MDTRSTPLVGIAALKINPGERTDLYGHALTLGSLIPGVQFIACCPLLGRFEVQVLDSELRIEVLPKREDVDGTFFPYSIWGTVSGYDMPLSYYGICRDHQGEWVRNMFSIADTSGAVRELAAWLDRKDPFAADRLRETFPGYFRAPRRWSFIRHSR